MSPVREKGARVVFMSSPPTSFSQFCCKASWCPFLAPCSRFQLFPVRKSIVCTSPSLFILAKNSGAPADRASILSSPPNAMAPMSLARSVRSS